MQRSIAVGVASLFVPWAMMACGGRAIEEGAPDGGACVTIDVSTYDRSCQQASDCVAITAGTLCDGDCSCGGATINADGMSRYQSAVSSITGGDCFCPDELAPECIANTCTICTGSANDPPACGDHETPDASTGQCVDVDLSTYDQSCNADSDCISITSGQICQGSCECGGSTINASGEARYEQQVSSITTSECPCPEEGSPRCIDGACTICGFGPNQPPGCDPPDADDGDGR